MFLKIGMPISPSSMSLSISIFLTPSLRESNFTAENTEAAEANYSNQQKIFYVLCALCGEYE